MGAFSVQKTKLVLKRKQNRKFLSLTTASKNQHISTTPLSAVILLFIPVYVNKAQKQFGADSPETPDKYTFESLARKKTQTLKPHHSDFESYPCDFLAKLWLLKLLSSHLIVTKWEEITHWEQI